MSLYNYKTLIKFVGETCFKVWPKRFYTSHNILKLAERGLWNDRFPASSLEFEKQLTSNASLTAYSGFDPTADSLHIGNLLVLTALLHFQRGGHNVIALVGGATGLIGDPSGRNNERPLIEAETVENNAKAIKSTILRIFNNHEEFIWKNKEEEESLKPVRIVDNIEWYRNLNLITFLRDIGKHMRMGKLLKRAAVQSRLQSNEPFSFTEFSYQVMQAYDWFYLHMKYGCNVQVGGSDQMGNIVCGCNLISRDEDELVTGLTVPLITTEEGNKLGKSAGNAIWLSQEKTSVFDFYQYFMRVKDSEVEKLLKLFTFINLKEIETIMKLHKEKPEERRAQKKLAEKLTLLVHGKEGLSKAIRASELLYGNNASVLADMSLDEIMELFKHSSFSSKLLESGTSVLDMAMSAGCFHNDRDAIRIIEAGGFYINQSRVTKPQLILIPGVHILPNGLTVARVGKKNYYIIKWNT